MAEAGPDPRIARVVVGVVPAALAGVYALAAPSRTDGAVRIGAAVALVASVLVLHLVWVMPRLGRWRRGWVVPAQALAAYTVVLAFGTSAVILAFVAGSLLAAGVPRPAVAWPLAAGVVGSATLIDVLRDGASVDVTITCLLAALVLYGLVRLADRADDAAAARLPLTLAAVGRERLRIAAELNRGLGAGLHAISAGARRAAERPEAIGDVLAVARRSLNDARAAAADFRSMSLAPEATAARALLEAADVRAEVRTGHREPLGPAGALLALVLREAVTDVVRAGTARSCLVETSERGGAVTLRVVNDGVRTAERGEDGLAEAAARVRAAGGAFSAGLGEDGRFAVEAVVDAGDRAVSVPDRTAYRLSLTLLATVLAGFCAKGLLLVPWGPRWAAAAVVLALVAVAQLGWTSTGRPRRWPLVLTVLSVAPVPVFGEAWLGLAGVLAGTFLVGFPARAAVPLVAATMAGAGAGAAALGLGTAATVNFTVSTLVTGLVVYGFVRLARLVRDLQIAGVELARAATVQERLRAARDLHDLLGHSLAAILLKCELARRLAGADPERARRELAEVVEMAERARGDLRAATGGEADLSLDGEVASARSVLTAAGVETDADHAPLDGRVDGEVSAVLGAVLREAVTNVLRHSAATRCAILTERDGDAVRLVVENDGVDPDAPRTPPGSGIGNLTTRLAAHGGTLSARADGTGRFRLEARIGQRTGHRSKERAIG
ncbi:sensor histidine kinase [Actinomadura decatromicini]|uniref:Two-component sensor histidine kinase n=1 Tax=Actinomadura decatromicini TaxID=2604572 RepID=A0A5D3FZX5_9ACTN|nr:histidine kinase [Actinomadura decatromicini]TYK53260.1 two-component sensor histidine kinase [Actinomadura decatromicini]